jgi:hypothetical protein
VAEYRAYVIDDDGHVLDLLAFAGYSDDDATTWAEQLVDGHDIEIWLGERLVISIPRKPIRPE